jgi:ribosome recycling factor
MIEIALTEGATAPFEKTTDLEMTKSLKHFEHELVSIRSGRAHPSMVEDIKVTCYGGDSELPLKNLASISVPEARSILVQPWDQTVVPDIERAIRESEAGLTPINDGNVIRLQLPEMSSDRREELIKLLGKKLEECRISIRGVRKNLHNLIRDSQKAKDISEDFAKRLSDLLQKATDKFIKKAEELSGKKEADLKL